MIFDLNLIELKNNKRKHTWYNLRNEPIYVLLDRFFCDQQWISQYNSCMVDILPRYKSDHNGILLKTDVSCLDQSIIFRYDSVWAQDEEFNSLVPRWWSDHIPHKDIAVNWKFKKQHLRKKMKGCW